MGPSDICYFLLYVDSSIFYLRQDNTLLAPHFSSQQVHLKTASYSLYMFNFYFLIGLFQFIKDTEDYY
jgi:hypothetical protein